MKETKKRSIAKTVSWRLVATVITFTLVFVATGKFDDALKIGLLDTTIKFLAYFIHERGWALSKFGTVIHPLADITVSRPLDPADREEVVALLKERGYLDEA